MCVWEGGTVDGVKTLVHSIMTHSPRLVGSEGSLKGPVPTTLCAATAKVYFSYGFKPPTVSSIRREIPNDVMVTSLEYWTTLVSLMEALMT